VPSWADATPLAPAAGLEGLRGEDCGVYTGLGFVKATVRGAFELLDAWRFL
jgi:hypothetical protein